MRPSCRRRQAAPRTGADAGAGARVDQRPPARLRELALRQDAIFVGGAGILLFGWSAGMICWFEAGVTDSFRPELDGMSDGLGFLAGSACPHYDGEPLRRPRYRKLVDSGFPEGVAADDGVGLHYVGTELRDAVTCRPGAAAYRVTHAGEEPLEARLIPS